MELPEDGSNAKTKKLSVGYSKKAICYGMRRSKHTENAERTIKAWKDYRQDEEKRKRGGQGMGGTSPQGLGSLDSGM